MRAKLALLATAAVALTLALSSLATADNNDGRFSARLSGYQETPATLSTPGSGSFTAQLNQSGPSLDYTLTYSGMPTTANAAHIHLGARATSGGVSAFLCGGGDKPPCPPTGGTVTGTIDPADVIGPTAQGIAPGEFAELVRAMRAGATYANVHTTERPGGEIRGQIGRGGGNNGRDGDDEDDDD
jgi:hypothetical protein